MTYDEVYQLLAQRIEGEHEIQGDSLVLKVRHKALQNLNYVPMVVTLSSNLQCHLRTFGLASVAEDQVLKAYAYCNELNMDPNTSVQFYLNDKNSIDAHYGFILLDDEAFISLCGATAIIRTASEVDRAYGALKKVLG